MATKLRQFIRQLIAVLAGIVISTDATDAVELLSQVLPVVELEQENDGRLLRRHALPRTLDDSIKKGSQGAIAVPDFQYTAVPHQLSFLSEGNRWMTVREHVVLFSLHFERELYLLHCCFRC